MANILKFTARSEETRNQEFLQDGDDILSFDIQNQKNGHVFPRPKETGFLKFKKSRNKDWSNQELANLFRVKRLLDNAGVPNEVDRGISDEGDPWFLFCDADSEVFIHLCRLDGIYVLDSPNIHTPLRGCDFNALIEQFTKQKLPIAEDSSNDTDHRVVRLERNGKVFMHPSTMLAALIWTLFLASEELVMLLPAKASGTPNPIDDSTTPTGTVDHSSMLDTTHLFADQEMSPEQSSPNNSIIQHVRDTMSFSDSKLEQNNYAIGLSIIAISLGFMTKERASNIENSALENMLVLLKSANKGEGQDADTLGKFGLDQNGASGFLESLTDIFENTDLFTQTDENTANTDENTANAEMINYVDATRISETETILRDVASKADSVLKERPQDQGGIPEAVTDVDASGVDASDNAVTDLAQNVATSQMSLMLSKFGLVDTFESFSTPSGRAYTIDSNTLYATFDINAGKLEKTNELIANSLVEAEDPKDPIIDTSSGFLSSDSQAKTYQSQTYNNEAYKFVSYILAKDGNLEIISMDNELIFIDPEIFGISSSDTYVMSWALDNGETISVIGMQSDYQSFELIA